MEVTSTVVGGFLSFLDLELVSEISEWGYWTNFSLIGLVILKIVFLLTREYQFSKISGSTTPSYVRYCIYRELKKRTPIGAKKNLKQKVINCCFYFGTQF